MVQSNSVKHSQLANFKNFPGGSMPAMVAPLLARLKDIDWSKVRIFAADERMVPLSDNDSNTGAYMKMLPSDISQSFVPYGPVDNSIACFYLSIFCFMFTLFC